MRNVITSSSSFIAELERPVVVVRSISRREIPPQAVCRALATIIAGFVQTLLNLSHGGRGLGDVQEFYGAGGAMAPRGEVEKEAKRGVSALVGCRSCCA